MSAWIFPPGHAHTTVAREPDEHAAQVMSVQQELDAVTVERDNVLLERDGLLERVSGLEEALEDRNAVVSRQATELSSLRAENSRLTDLVNGTAGRIPL